MILFNIWGYQLPHWALPHIQCIILAKLSVLFQAKHFLDILSLFILLLLRIILPYWHFVHIFEIHECNLHNARLDICFFKSKFRLFCTFSAGRYKAMLCFPFSSNPFPVPRNISTKYFLADAKMCISGWCKNLSNIFFGNMLFLLTVTRQLYRLPDQLTGHLEKHYHRAISKTYKSPLGRVIRVINQKTKTKTRPVRKHPHWNCHETCDP